MASIASIPQTQLFIKKPISSFKQIITTSHKVSIFRRNFNHNFAAMVLGKIENSKMKFKASMMTTSAEVKKGFVEEMRSVAMKLHTKEQAPKEGEKVAKGPEEKSPAKWDPTIEGYLKFLVDSKLVYDTLERIVQEAPIPYYAEFRNTGLERSQNLAKDLEWFKEQGHTIPEPSEPGETYAKYLEELAQKDPQAFICHFYNVYFAHSAGGIMIGRKVAEKILNKKELEFYKWDGDLKQLLQNVREKLNKVAESWTREEKNHCLEETEKSFMYSGKILRLIFA
ncbi:unnamed protein product [Amaranthus hypochondriacus]